jgi:hypothetical protein
MKKEWLVKTPVLGVIFLFISAAIVPNITAGDKNNISSEEICDVSCLYFTADGIFPVVKKITLEKANLLSQLMNGSDNDAIVSQLNQLNLISNKISIAQAKELISGRYGQKIF